ncbi:hypothetical protein PoB_002135700 [Plakobranchus ocellatus]|uniref:Uncharacterized protein n=1 Tax=Plakobranchus ocellatus TaxID=259542 RepID=A0AAV3ZJY4_9GAST|nr:hypothetical protein PoB_002135700 [Plakobranchus ocellatus]
MAIERLFDRGLKNGGRAGEEIVVKPLAYHATLDRFDGNLGASVAQWLASPPRDLQGPFCRGFEPRHQRLGLTEGPKA